MIKRSLWRMLRRAIPQECLATARNFKILSLGFGQFRSIRQWASVDRDGNPIPWYAYPAIEYIKQLDISDKTVFEYGSGNSSIFWSRRCRKLVSVESDREWYSKVQPMMPDGADYLFLSRKEEYIKSITRYPYDFDVIIIDGLHRYECALEALTKLKHDGFIILDNSDWMEKTSELLRSSDLIEVDMSGFGPINNYTTTTSFYFRRGVNLRPGHDRQPIHGVGSLPRTEADAATEFAAGSH
jgi:hypothetical protein